MNQYNLWKYDAKEAGSTGGWIFIGIFHGLSEKHVLSMAAIKFKIKKMWLRAYEHIDSMPGVRS